MMEEFKFKRMMYGLCLMVVMTTTCIHGAVDNQKPARGDPLWDWDETQKDDTNALNICQQDLIQCRQNLADIHEKMLVDAMYDQTEAHDKLGNCKKEEKFCREDLADCKLGCPSQVPVHQDDSLDSPCKLEQMFFRRFAKHFINLLIKEAKEDDTSLEADVRVELSQYSWGKLRQFVQQKGKVKLVDAHDLMSDMLISARHDNSTVGRSWLERVTGMESTNIKFYALLCALSVMVVLFESTTQSTWKQQLCAVMFVLFIISVGWNWIYLYKKEFANRMAEMQKLELNMPVSCRPDKMTWWDSMKEVVRNQMTFQDDPCKKYHENLLVDPIYEIPPTRAISHTISVMFLEPLQVLGKNLAGFHRELLKDLPYGAWIPTLLSVYLSPVLVIIVMCYCLRYGQVRRDAAAWNRVRMLENQLRERDAIDERRGRNELENPRQEVYMPLPAGNPVRDNRQLFDAPAGRHQRQVRRDQPDEVLAPERPRPRRRQRGSSESDLLQQQRPQRQQFIRDLGEQSAPYHGDASDCDDSSDDAGAHMGQQRPRALHLEGGPSTSGQVIRPSRVAPHQELRSNTSDIQGQPIDCPLSEMDSLEVHPTLRGAVGGKGEVQSRTKGSRVPKIQGGQKMQPKGDKPPDTSSSRRMADLGDPHEETRLEEEVKLKKDEAKIAGPSHTVSATLTPASSTDSEPFMTSSALGCDSPSSVSVIEGDSSPASGGSMDGDTHLQSLGTSLSGSIDVIEPLGALGGKEEHSEDGHESDEFEVLSREQCQT